MTTGITFYFEWEVALIEWFQNILGSAGTTIASVLSEFGEEIILVAILGFVYWCYDKEFGKYLMLNVMIGMVFYPMVKNVALRRRPYFDNPGIKCLKPVDKGADIYDISAQGFSFPSGHAVNSACTYGGMAVYKKQKVFIIIGIVIPLIVGISRFILGVHYPTDVIAGIVLGYAICFIMDITRKKVKNAKIAYLVIFLLSACGMLFCRTTDYFTAFGLMSGFLAGILFEDRFIHFDNTRIIWKGILRIIGGAGIYLGLNYLLKLPFSEELLESATMTSFMIRYVRYTIIGFAIIGLYPMIFRKEHE